MARILLTFRLQKKAQYTSNKKGHLIKLNLFARTMLLCLWRLLEGGSKSLFFCFQNLREIAEKRV